MPRSIPLQAPLALLLLLAVLPVHAAAQGALADTTRVAYEARDVPEAEPAELDLAGAACQSVARYLNVRSVREGSLTPDGRRLAYVTSTTGLPQLWTVSLDEKDHRQPVQLTFGNRVQFAAVSPRGDWILYGSDRGGDERTQFFLISPDGTRERELTPADGNFRVFGGWAPAGDRIAYSSAERDGRNFDIWTLDVDAEGHPGERRMVLEGAGNLGAEAWRPDGQAMLLSRGRGEADNDLFLLDFATGRVDTLFVPEQMSAYRSFQWSPDGTGFYMATNHLRDLAGLAHYDLASGAMTWLAEPAWDVRDVALSHDGRYLAWTVNEEAWSRLHVRDLETGADLELPPPPPGVVTSLSWAEDAARLAIAVTGPQTPGDFWVYHPATAEMTRITHSSTAGLDPAEWVSPEHVAFESFDGMTVYGLLYLPRTAGAEPPPVVVTLHGGPTSQGQPRFDAVNQYLLSRGYAIFDYNYRGSTGYGQAFTQADNMRRRTDGIRDLEAAAHYLRQRGDVDGTRLAAMGASYGGFMTLAALAWYPELYTAGVNIVGVANWITALEDASPALKNSDLIEYGDIDDPDDREFFRSISPIHFADGITGHLMVIHGANDPRVPVAEADQIVSAVRGAGGEVDYLRFPDEGHGIARLQNRITAYQRVARFLDHSIGGAEMPCYREVPAQPSP